MYIREQVLLRTVYETDGPSKMEFMRPATVLAVVATAVLCGCAGQTRLPSIPNGENVVILVVMDPQADGKLNIRNEALGAGVSTGAGTGIVPAAFGAWRVAPWPYCACPLAP